MGSVSRCLLSKLVAVEHGRSLIRRMHLSWLPGTPVDRWFELLCSTHRMFPGRLSLGVNAMAGMWLEVVVRRGHPSRSMTPKWGAKQAK